MLSEMLQIEVSKLLCGSILSAEVLRLLWDLELTQTTEKGPKPTSLI